MNPSTIFWRGLAHSMGLGLARTAVRLPGVAASNCFDRAVMWDGRSRTLTADQVQHEFGMFRREPRAFSKDESDVRHIVCRESWAPNGSDASGTRRFKLDGELILVPERWIEAIRESPTPVRIQVNSFGGDGRAAWEALEGFGPRWGVHIINAASAAANLAVCCPGRRTMAKGATLMLHGVAVLIYGTAAMLRTAANQLDQHRQRWVERISQRTGQPRELVEQWEGAEDCHFTPEQALHLNLVDEIVDQ